MRSLRAVVRVALATLLLAGGLIFTAPAPPVDAQAMPDWNCDNSTPELTLITCADEAAFVGVSVAVFAGSYLPLLTAMGTAAFVDFVTGGMDYDQCIDELPGPLEHRCSGLPGDDTPGKGWVNKNPSEMPEGVLEGFCYIWPWFSGCAALKEDPTGHLAEVGTLPDYATWGLPDRTHSPFGFRLVGRVNLSGLADGEYLIFGRASPAPRYAVWVEVGSGGTQFRTGFWGHSDSVNDGGYGAWIPLSGKPWVYIDVPASGSRVGSVGVSFGESAPGIPGSSVLDNNNMSGSHANTARSGMVGAPIRGGVEAVWEEVLFWNDSALGPSMAWVQNIPQEFEPYVEGEEVPSPFPVPEAPPAVPVPWPDAPGAPEAPEVDPAPEPDQYEEVSEGTGDEGLFDRLANRIGSAINNVVNAIGSVAGWVVGQLGALLEWLLDQIRELFQWLGDLIEGLLLWIGELLEWLGGLLQQVIDAIEQMTSLLGWWFQGLIDAIFNAIGSLGDLLNGALQSVIDVLSSIWDALAQLAGQIGEAIGEALSTLGQAIIDGIQAVIELLFIPDSLDLDGIGDECEQSFPCSWIAEFADALELLGAGVGGAAEGACTTPAIGWSEFRASLPPPSGCSVNGDAAPMGGEASTAGDLWGYRTAFRSLAFVVAAWVFITAVIQMTPWAESRYYRLNPTQLELF